MSTTRSMFTLLVLALSLGGCAKQHQATAHARHHAMPARAQHEALPMTSGRTHVRAPAFSDAQILGALIGANRSEVSEAELVAHKTTNPVVREFATRMVTDHSGGAREIEALATRRGITPASSRISDRCDEATRNELEQIRRRSGNDLDRQYVEHEIGEHHELLGTIDRDLVPNTTDPEIREALSKTRSVVAAHLEHARTVRGQLPR